MSEWVRKLLRLTQFSAPERLPQREKKGLLNPIFLKKMFCDNYLRFFVWEQNTSSIIKTYELNLGLRGAGGKNIASYPNHSVCYEAQNRTVSTEE